MTLYLCAVALNKAAHSELCRLLTPRRRSEKGEYQLAEWDLRTIRHCKFICYQAAKLKQALG